MAMPKVKLRGEVRLDFDVKYGLDKDIELRIHAIPIDVEGKVYKVLVGEGDISYIPEKTLSFIGAKIESLLRRDKTLIGVDGWEELFRYGYIGNVKDDKFPKALFKTALGKLMLRAYKLRDASALDEVLRKNLWFVSETGMREFVSWKKASEKAREKDIPFSAVKRAKELI